MTVLVIQSENAFTVFVSKYFSVSKVQRQESLKNLFILNGVFTQVLFQLLIKQGKTKGHLQFIFLKCYMRNRGFLASSNIKLPWLYFSVGYFYDCSFIRGEGLYFYVSIFDQKKPLFELRHIAWSSTFKHELARGLWEWRCQYFPTHQNH